MALNPGTRRLLWSAASWGGGVLIVAAAVTHLGQLRSGAEQLLGPLPADVAARQDAAGDDATVAVQSPGTIMELKAGRNGHFNTEAEVNGRPIEVMVDTGATLVALSYEDAERAGIYLNNSDFNRSVSTANGVARIAPVTLDRVSIGDITVRNVPAAVAEPGRLKTSLLGMTFLSRLSRFDMRSGVLVLQE
jgi:aspartyl protease family protein